MSPALSESDHRYVLEITRRIVRDPELAADAAQDALLSAHVARDQFAGRSAFRTWLHRIAVFAALAQLRWLRRTRLAIGAGIPDVADPAPTPRDALADREQRAHLAARVAAVPAPLRDVLLMRMDGHSPPEIARALGISVTNVKVRTHRARQQLRLALVQGS